MLRSANPILTALLVAAMPGLAVPAQGQAGRPMTIVDMIEVPSLSDPQISPDGEQVLYVRSDADWELNRTVGHIWRVAVGGGAALQLTTGREGQASPRWSPDGTWIAFLAERASAPGHDDEENGDARQIHLLNTAGGEAMPLTDHPTSVSSIQWSPDGAFIYFLATDEKTGEQKRRDEAEDDVFAFDEDWQHRHLWRVRVSGGDRERITEGDFSVRSYDLSWDGTRVVLHRAPTPLLDDSDDAEVWIADRTGDDAVRITDNAVPENGARLSPDNSMVLWISGSDGDRDPYYNDRIFVAPPAGGPATVLMPDLPYEVNGAEWSADGTTIYFTANTGVRVELFRVDAAGGTPHQLTRGDHQVANWTFHPQVGRHVFGLNHAEDPGEVHVLDSDGGQPVQLTNVFEYLDEFALPTQEAITWAGEDGVEVEGLLYLPADHRPGERYGLMVQTHGGPASSDRFRFPRSSRFVPILTELGYAVLKPNYRGSTGYGDEFLRDMVGHYFNQAHLDVMAGVDALIERGIVDGDRMAKMGWSAGGHMTNKIITHTDRFKAAASGAGAANWISMYAQSDVRIYRAPWFGGDPWSEDAPIDRFMADSPLFSAHQVTTPTIFLVGQEDPRVPMPQSVEMYRALKANEVPTHLYVAPREGHGWRELRHRVFLSNVQLDWFERWVMDREWTWEEAPDEAEKNDDQVAAGSD